MTISLSEDMQRFVETQAAKEGYASPSDYLNAILKEAQKRKARKNLEAKLDEALASGPSEPMTREDWESIEREVWERDRENRWPTIVDDRSRENFSTEFQ
jgi:Arc/MetJ-type ribon-helix-helix transcriptional regulator